MSTVVKNRYSDKDLEEFKSLIEEKIDKANEDLSLLKSSYMNNGNNGTEDTSPTFKAFEEGSETMSKERFSHSTKSLYFQCVHKILCQRSEI